MLEFNYGKEVEAIWGPEKALQESIRWNFDVDVFINNVMQYTKWEALKIINEAKKHYAETKNEDIVEAATLKIIDIYKTELARKAFWG